MSYRSVNKLLSHEYMNKDYYSKTLLYERRRTVIFLLQKQSSDTFTTVIIISENIMSKLKLTRKRKYTRTHN